MLSYRTIDPHTLELLKALQADKALGELRLVGGTALALQYGHRCSIDLDLFGHIDIEDDDLIELLRCYGNVEVRQLTKNIKIFTIDGIKVDIVNYKYPWIDDPIEEDGIVLASPKDIAAMKVNAIEGRGTKKDFIDIFELLKYFSLKEILDMYAAKYPENSIFRALLSLSYFDDADTQPMPTMFTDDDWSSIKVAITTHIQQYEN